MKHYYYLSLPHLNKLASEISASSQIWQRNQYHHYFYLTFVIDIQRWRTAQRSRCVPGIKESKRY
jgi:hypothetical protein